MSQLLDDLVTPSDAELISRVRSGDADAYAELFTRHVDAARRLARQLARGPDVDDLVSDAVTKVMAVLQRGGGPDVSFRAYLLTAVRRVHVDRVRAQSRLTPTDDLGEFDPGVPFHDTAVASFENGAVARAFATLPERWQMVLWHLEVEGQKPADVARLLGMSANSVSALAYRAREGLRQAFLAAHLADTPPSDCRWVLEHLGGHVRKGLARRESAKVQVHLDDCRRCTATYLELCEVNADLRGVLAPLLLGSLAAGYLASSGSAAGSATGVVAILGRAKEYVGAQLVPSAGGAVATTVAVATAVALSIGGTPSQDPAEDGDGGRSAIADTPWTVNTPLPGSPAPSTDDRGTRDAVSGGSGGRGGPLGTGDPGVSAPFDAVPLGGRELARLLDARTQRLETAPDPGPTLPVDLPEAPGTPVVDAPDRRQDPTPDGLTRRERPDRVKTLTDKQPDKKLDTQTTVQSPPDGSSDRPEPGTKQDPPPDARPDGNQKGKGPGHDQGLHKGHHKPHPQGKQPGHGQDKPQDKPQDKQPGKQPGRQQDKGKGPK